MVNGKQKTVKSGNEHGKDRIRKVQMQGIFLIVMIVFAVGMYTLMEMKWVI